MFVMPHTAGGVNFGDLVMNLNRCRSIAGRTRTQFRELGQHARALYNKASNCVHSPAGVIVAEDVVF